MRGAEAVIRALEKEGVQYIAGFSGGGLNPLWEPLRTSDTIKVFATRHERLGVEIADGYARATQSVGVAMTGTGPGRPIPSPASPAATLTTFRCCYSWGSTPCAISGKNTNKKCPPVFSMGW